MLPERLGQAGIFAHCGPRPVATDNIVGADLVRTARIVGDAQTDAVFDFFDLRN